MKNFRNIAMTLVLLIAGALNVCLAQTSAAASNAMYVEKSFAANFHFPVNKTTLDLNYLSNPETVASLKQMIDSIGVENIKSIEIVSNASPEGNLEHNIYLAKARGSEINSFFRKNYSGYGFAVSVVPSGESWSELRDLVVVDTLLSDSSKSKILSVIDADVNVVEKKSMMKTQLGNDARVGVVYNYLVNFLYAQVRNSSVVVNYTEAVETPEIAAVEEIAVIDTVVDNAVVELSVDSILTAVLSSNDTLQVVDVKVVVEEAYEEELLPEPTAAEEPTATEEPIIVEEPIVLETPTFTAQTAQRESMLSVKTNLLYDAAYIPNKGFKPALNVEAEYYFRNSNWSALAEFDSPWYSEPETHFYFQIQNFQLEGRRYLNLGKNSVQNSHNGLYVSAYAMFNMFDLCFSEEGNGKQGEGAGAGIGLGYVMPISKSGKWKLEFSLKAGYYESHYDNYHYSVNDKGVGKYYYNWEGESEDFIRRNWRFRWVGPTSVGVTLSYDILSRKVK